MSSSVKSTAWPAQQKSPSNVESEGMEVFVITNEKFHVRQEEDAPQAYREYVDKEVAGRPSSLGDKPTPIKPKQSLLRRKRIIFGVISIIALIGVILGAIFGARAANGRHVKPDPSNNEDLGPVTSSYVVPEATPSSEPSSTPSSEPSSTPSKPASAPTPMPLSARPGKMLSAASFRSEKKKESTIYVAYQSLDNDFQILRYVKPDGSKKGSWRKPYRIIPENNPKGITAMGIGLVQLTDPDGFPQEVRLTMSVVNSRVLSFQFSADVNSDDKAFDSIRTLEERPVYGGINSTANLATCWSYVITEEAQYSAQIRQINWQSHDSWATRMQVVAPRQVADSEWAIVRLSITEGWDINENYLVGYFYEGAQGTLSVGTVWDHGELFQKFPKDISLPHPSSFTAFSVAHSNETANKQVDMYVLYQNEAGDFKQVSTTDNGKDWQKSSPKALRGGDVGTKITCTSPETVRVGKARILEPISDMTRCYFFRGGRLSEAQFDGQDWKSLGEVPLT